MNRLQEQVKKYLGIAPYDGFNPVKGDGYFLMQMNKEFRRGVVAAEIARQRK